MNRKWLDRKQSRAEPLSWRLSADIDENHQKTLWPRSRFEQRTTRIQDKECTCKADWLAFTIPKKHPISFDIIHPPPTPHPQSKQRLHKRSISSGYWWRQVVITITPTLIRILSVTFQQRASAPLGINYTFVFAGATSSLARIFFQSNLSHRMEMMRDGLALQIQRGL